MIRLNKSPLSNITTKNFKQLCLEKLDGTQNSIPAKKVARKGINPYASIVTSDAEFAKAQAEVEEKDRDVLRKEEAKRVRAETKLAKERDKEEKRAEKERKKQEVSSKKGKAAKGNKKMRKVMLESDSEYEGASDWMESDAIVEEEEREVKEAEGSRKNHKLTKKSGQKEERAEKGRKRQKESGKNGKSTKNTEAVLESDSESESASESSVEDEARFDDKDEQAEQADMTHFKTMVANARASFPPITEKQAVIYLKRVWEGICPPVHEDSFIDSWFAAIYYPEVIGGSSRPILYVGKVIRRFLQDSKRVAQFLELDCLQPAFKTKTTQLLEIPGHLPRDNGLFPIPDIIAGPLYGEHLGNIRWLFPEYPDVVTTYILVSKMNRETISADVVDN